MASQRGAQQDWMVDSSAGLKWVESVWCGEREDKPAAKKERKEEDWGKTRRMLRWRLQEVATTARSTAEDNYAQEADGG
ncbi:hypothetical protein AOLI_G00081900 [Acnodon oligacanthus]